MCLVFIIPLLSLSIFPLHHPSSFHPHSSPAFYGLILLNPHCNVLSVLELPDEAFSAPSCALWGQQVTFLWSLTCTVLLFLHPTYRTHLYT